VHDVPGHTLGRRRCDTANLPFLYFWNPWTWTSWRLSFYSSSSLTSSYPLLIWHSSLVVEADDDVPVVNVEVESPTQVVEVASDSTARTVEEVWENV